MIYDRYLRNKLGISESENLVDSAVQFLGGNYPSLISDEKKHLTIDKWMEAIIQKWKVNVKIANYPSSTFLGKLESSEGGFVINLNRNLFGTKKRYTLAHELAHLLSYNVKSKWPRIEISHTQEEEFICDKIARAILLPKSLINYKKFEILKFDKPQLDFFIEIWRDFQVGPWQVFKKIVDESEIERGVCILWKYFQTESCLRIVDYYHLQNVFIPKNDRIFLNSFSDGSNKIPEIAFNTNSIYSGIDLVNIGSIYKKKHSTISFPIESKAGNYIMQLINLNPNIPL